MEHSLISVFGAGLLTLVTPCILPMLPVYLTLLLGASIDSVRSPKDRFRLLAAAALFVAGFSLVFTLLGLGASSLGSLLHDQRELLLIVGGLLIAFFGLKYLGLVRIPFLDRTVQMKGVKTGSRALDGFLFGVVFALGWTPCVGPILGSVLTYTAATATGALSGAGHLFVYSMGVGIPLLVVSLLADRLLPGLRALNEHLPKFEKGTGVVMIAVGLFLALPAGFHLVTRDSSQETQLAYPGGGVGLTSSLGSPSEKPRLVKFYTESCPACERMKPRFRQLEQDCMKREVEILAIDISDRQNVHLARRFDVRAVPTITLFDADGAIVGRILGERDLPELRAAAAVLMSSVCKGERGRLDFDQDAPVLCEASAGESLVEGEDAGPPAVECAAIPE